MLFFVLHLGPVSIFYKILDPLHKTQKKLMLPFLNISYLALLLNMPITKQQMGDGIPHVTLMHNPHYILRY